MTKGFSLEDSIGHVTVLAEIGDLSRFQNPRELMGYLGPALTAAARVVPAAVRVGTKKRAPRSNKETRNGDDNWIEKLLTL